MSRPRRRNTTPMPASSRVRAAKPSAAICSRKPKCLVRNWAEAATSSTFSDTAEAVILTGPPGLGGALLCTKYRVQRTEVEEVFPIPSPRTGAGDPARTLRLLCRGPGAGPRHGPSQQLSVEKGVGAGTALPDAEGLEAVNMRRGRPGRRGGGGCPV